MVSGRMVCVGVLITVLATPSASSAKVAVPDTTAIAVPDSILANPTVDWRLSDLSSMIGDRVHLTADRVPPFPQEDPRLMDSRKWPRVTVIWRRALLSQSSNWRIRCDLVRQVIGRGEARGRI